MTTPRDAIAGLSERLNQHARFIEHWNATSSPERHAALESEAVEALPKLKEAATQLDSLLIERDALQASNRTAKKWQQWAEDERAKYEARATRLQQERDEAYERAAKECDFMGAREQERCGLTRGAQNYFRARDAIRRLAGPEKEKKE